MNNTIFLSIGALFYVLMITIIYTSKVRLKTFDNKVYSKLLIVTIISLISELLMVPFMNNEVILNFFMKLFLIALTVWVLLMFTYLLNIIYKDKGTNISKYLTVFTIIADGLIISLNIDYYYENNILIYSYGPGVNIAYIVCGLFLTGMVILMLLNISKLKQKKTTPILTFIILIIIAVIFQKINSKYLLTNFVLGFVVSLMYFTIENPDVKIIEEVSKIKDLNEKANEEKSSFLYLVTDEINSIIKEVELKVNNILESKSAEESKNIAHEIKAMIDNSKTKLKRTIDISSIDSNELKLSQNKYDLNNLLDQICINTKNMLKENVEFRSSLSPEIPKYVYGDQIRLKQIITTVIDNSIKYTKEGFIELRVSSIVKNDVCRLIISVEDSGKGIDILKQSEILSNHDDLSKEELENKDNKNLNLKTVKKIITLIGGTLSIDSYDNKGTKIQITLDQKIADNDHSNNEIDKYDEILKKHKSIALISLDKNDIKSIKSLCHKLDYDYHYFDVTKDCLVNIRNNIKYDIVIIDENMDKINAKSFLMKVKEVETFKGSVYVIANHKSLEDKKELLNEGFKSILIKPIKLKEIEEFFK